MCGCASRTRENRRQIVSFPSRMKISSRRASFDWFPSWLCRDVVPCWMCRSGGFLRRETKFPFRAQCDWDVCFWSHCAFCALPPCDVDRARLGNLENHFVWSLCLFSAVWRRFSILCLRCLSVLSQARRLPPSIHGKLAPRLMFRRTTSKFLVLSNTVLTLQLRCGATIQLAVCGRDQPKQAQSWTWKPTPD